MPAHKKYPDELRERAIRMVIESRAQNGHYGAIPRVAEELSISRETLASWISQVDRDALGR